MQRRSASATVAGMYAAQPLVLVETDQPPQLSGKQHVDVQLRVRQREGGERQDARLRGTRKLMKKRQLRQRLAARSRASSTHPLGQLLQLMPQVLQEGLQPGPGTPTAPHQHPDGHINPASEQEPVRDCSEQYAEPLPVCTW